MKLLFDQNLSHRLVSALDDLFPGSHHIRLLGMEKADDETIWQYARDNGFTIVTQDSDFNERSLIHGCPPKIVWIRCGNTSTSHILKTLRQHHQDLIEFDTDEETSCLELY